MVKFYLRSVGVILVVILIAIVANIIFSFTGNPIYSSNAEKKILNYANKNFNAKALNKSECQYSFKDNIYYISFSSKTSKDIHFNLYYDAKNDSIDSRDYELKVTRRFNTIERLQKEYSQLLREILEKNYPKAEYQIFEEIKVELIDSKEKNLKNLNLDARLSEVMNYPAKVELKIRTNDNSNFYNALEMRIFHRLLEENNIYMKEYTFMFNRLLESKVYLGLSSEKITDKDFINEVERISKGV